MLTVLDHCALICGFDQSTLLILMQARQKKYTLKENVETSVKKCHNFSKQVYLYKKHR